MLRAEQLCLITHVGELKGDKFKKCVVRVVTKEVKDEISNDLIRASGTFDTECSPGDTYPELKKLAEYADPPWSPCVFILRSYKFKDKKTNAPRIGMQLLLKRWWR